MVTTAVQTAEPRPRLDSPRDGGHRPDIQALRALAVMLVLTYHLWPSRVTGGYVGVDVFFVISGFLITSHLLRELTSTSRIRLGRFWARRATRLLPASLLVLAATAIAVIMLAPRSLWNQFLGEITASTLYVQNWKLAADSVDYLAGGYQASPVQHFWTLSVEEQFYVGLPLLLTGAGLIGLRWGIRRAVFVTIAGVTLLSFAYGIWSTNYYEGVSYFSTLSRAWEFGFGALLAFAPTRLVSRFSRWLAVGGVLLIVIAGLAFTANTPFPGVGALLPVVGTSLALWGGRGSLLSSAGTLQPVAGVGRMSYSLYLWHWPLIIMLPFVSGVPLRTPDKLAIFVAAMVLAWLTTRFVEDPVRFSPRLLAGRRPRTVAIAAVAGMGVVLAILAGAAFSSATASARSASAANELTVDDVACLGAAQLANPGCVNPALDEVLTPDPSALDADDANRAECWSTGTDATFRSCSVGPDSGYERHLIAVGDSHNNTLIGAYEKIAIARNWRIDVAGRAGCYWTDADLRMDTQAATENCRQWRRDLVEFIDSQSGLDGIITTKARIAFGVEVVPDAGDSVSSAAVDGMTTAWSRRPDLSVPVIALVDNPAIPKESVRCTETRGLAAENECTIPLADALPDDGIQMAAENTPNSRVIDLTALYCTEVCAPIVGHVVVYRNDGRHLTATYADTIAPYLGAEIERSLVSG
ncbi:acyltransferase family protein [Leifsonia flava]|nr:acyltransferase family protein [Leifsonia flava]